MSAFGLLKYLLNAGVKNFTYYKFSTGIAYVKICQIQKRPTGGKGCLPLFSMGGSHVALLGHLGLERGRDRLAGAEDLVVTRLGRKWGGERRQWRQ